MCTSTGLSRRASVQAGSVDAAQRPPDSAAAQLQLSEHAQPALPAWGRGTAPWQPQEQSRPGQLAHWQEEASRECMEFPFVGANPAGP